MIIYDLLFYIFAFLLVSSSIAVISVKNSVHAVFFLIFSFLNVAGLFVLLGAEFLAMTLIIVYVGAVAILFLFVVMMLDVEVSDIKQYALKHRKLLLLVSTAFAVELIAIVYSSISSGNSTILSATVPMVMDGVKSNTQQIGLILYTDYGYLFQICGLILFTAIISTITLTHRQGNKLKKIQDVQKQISRNRKNSIVLVNPKTGAGVDVIDRK